MQSEQIGTCPEMKNFLEIGEADGKQKGPAPTGAREQGGETNHSFYTLLLPCLQVIEGHLLLILIFVERVVKVVMR